MARFAEPEHLFDAHGVPAYWYNILPVLAEHLEPVPPPQGSPQQMALVQQVTVAECLRQETSDEPWIAIPEDLRQMYVWPLKRPRELVRVEALERALGTPAELWVMTEFDSPTGSHKINTAVAQAYFARHAGKKRLVTETGAGQWGTAVAAAASMFGLKATVFWVRNVMQWKANRLLAMENYGAEVFASPSPHTRSGRSVLAEDPDHPGDLGIAISEGVETAAADPDACYVLGSVLNHVLIHQTVIGLEARRQLRAFDRRPAAMVSCFGGGSNFGGFILPTVGTMLAAGERDIRFIAYQSESFPNLVRGEYRYDSPDHAGLLPMLKMYTLGAAHRGEAIRAGGLQYHGAAPILSLLKHHGYIEAYTYAKDEAKILEAGRLFARYTGWNPAAESAYAIAGAFDLANEARGSGSYPVIVANVSGRADMEMETYTAGAASARR
jgi:tryptophan synthase beta chain